LDNLRLIGGIRYSDDKKTLDGTLTTFAPPSPINPVDFQSGVTPSDPSSWDSTTWRAGAQWDVTDKSMIYGTVSTGFHSGGFFLTHDNPSFAPETIKAYTVGTKNQFLDDRLQVDLEAFYWLYKNQQLSAVTFDSTFSTVFQTFNAASSHIKGFELSADYILGENTLLTGQLQYLDSTFESFSFREAAFGYSAASKCSGTFSPPAFENVNCTGLQLPNSPKWTMNLGIQQTFPLDNGANLIGSVHEHYQSASYLAVSYLPTDLQKAYWMGDVSLTYTLASKGWDVTAFINNFTNETVMYSTNHAVAQVDTAQLAAPRTYGLRISKDF
jgi:iron complex outermembrane receptor protein